MEPCFERLPILKRDCNDHILCYKPVLNGHLRKNVCFMSIFDRS